MNGDKPETLERAGDAIETLLHLELVEVTHDGERICLTDAARILLAIYTKELNHVYVQLS